MVKKEQEEYRSTELIEFKEMKVFEAEDFRNLEHIRLNMETYKNEEIIHGSSPTATNNGVGTNNIDSLKQGLKALGSSITTATVAVGAGIVGAGGTHCSRLRSLHPH